MTSAPSPMDSQRILVLSAEGAHRENMRNSLLQFRYSVSFSSVLGDALDLIVNLRPGILIHDWSVAEPTQSAVFQQRLGRLDEFRSLLRIMLCKQITPQLLALVHDCGVRRILSYATSNLSLGTEIEMARSAGASLSELQQFVRDLRAAVTSYSQEKVDDMVERAHAQFAHDPSVRLEFGNLCLRRANLSEARRIARELLAEDGANVRAMNLYARTLMKEGNFPGAIAVLERANGLSPKNLDRLLELGRCFFKTGQTSRAKDCYAEALELEPQSKDARVGLGRAVLSEGDAQAALALFTEGVSDEEAASYFNSAAIQAVHDTRMQEALQLYETALAALHGNGNKATIHFNLALWHKKQGRLEEALRSLKRCLKLDPDHTKARAKLQEIERSLRTPA